MAMSSVQHRWWNLAKTLLWFLGVAIVIALILFPLIGLHAFWNVLIPVAPAVVALTPGIWRNICPLGMTSQIPRRFGFSRQMRLTAAAQGWFILVAVVLLFVLIPPRHTIFNTSGIATAILLLAIGVVALVSGFLFDGKSGWCAGLCPVHQVEKLYGQRPTCTVENAQCLACNRCVSACPDSTPGVNPHTAESTRPKRAAVFVFIGAFPGFIWGWFQVPDYEAAEGLSNLVGTYLLPLASAGATLAVYALLISSMPLQRRRTIDRLFAAAAISTYYWFRIPALIGFGAFPGDGMLLDLSGTIPPQVVWVFCVVLTIFWVWWIAGRRNGLRPWMVRPPFEDQSSSPVRLPVSTG